MGNKMSKRKEVCGNEYIVKWRSTKMGNKWQSYLAICNERPKHWGKHREVLEW